MDLRQSFQEVPEVNESYQEGVDKLSKGDFETASEILEKAVEENDDPKKIKMLAVIDFTLCLERESNSHGINPTRF